MSMAQLAGNRARISILASRILGLIRVGLLLLVPLFAQDTLQVPPQLPARYGGAALLSLVFIAILGGSAVSFRCAGSLRERAKRFGQR